MFGWLPTKTMESNPFVATGGSILGSGPLGPFPKFFR